MPRKNTLESILGRTIKTESGCMIWPQSKNINGYGLVGYEGRLYIASRLVYRLIHGEFDPALVVCHTCDNPACINPAHLWLGTRQQNSDDCVIKGRTARDESHPNTKLTAEQKAVIRASTISTRKLAAQYHVSQTLIAAVKLGRR